MFISNSFLTQLVAITRTAKVESKLHMVPGLKEEEFITAVAAQILNVQ
jgi:hypothetical protein